MSSCDDDLEKFRLEIIRLASGKRTRRVGSECPWPCDWRPYATTDHRTGELFTEARAWEFITSLLEAGHEFRQMTLDNPKGKRGYVLKVKRPEVVDLYIKLQIGSGVIYGRSFHDSYGKEKD